MVRYSPGCRSCWRNSACTWVWFVKNCVQPTMLVSSPAKQLRFCTAEPDATVTLVCAAGTFQPPAATQFEFLAVPQRADGPLTV